MTFKKELLVTVKCDGKGCDQIRSDSITLGSKCAMIEFFEDLKKEGWKKAQHTGTYWEYQRPGFT